MDYGRFNTVSLSHKIVHSRPTKLRIVQLDRELKKKCIEVDELKEKVQAHEQKASIFEQEKTVLTRSLKAITDEFIELKERSRSDSNQAQELNAQNAELNQQISRLKASVEYEKSLRKSAEAKNNLLGENMKLKIDLLSDQLSSAEQKTRFCDTKIVELEQKLTECTIDLSVTKKSGIASTPIGSTRKTQAQNQAQDQLVQKLNDTLAQNEQLQKQVDELTASESNLKDRISKVNNDKTKLEIYVKKLEEDHSELQKNYKILNENNRLFDLPISSLHYNDQVNNLRTKGDDAYSKKDYTGALKLFNEAIFIEKANRKDTETLAALWEWKAFCYDALKTYKHAIQAFSKAIEYRPGDPYFYTRRGELYIIHSKDFSNARKDAEKALELEASNEKAKKLLEMINSRRGK